MTRFGFVSRVIALLGIVSLSATAQHPDAIERHLRFGVKLANQPDTALSLLDRMQAYHVPGVSIAIIDNWRVVYAKGFGVKEFGGNAPVDSNTLFLAGSVSKPVFASGFLRMVEDKKIPLDSNVNALLKSWKLPESRFTEKDKVTLRRLLTHSAGLTVWGFPGYDLSKPVPTVPQLLDGTAPANTPAVRNDTFPGAMWRYSGGGMTIAQLIATDISGESFPALMKRLMLEPAGMKRSTYENPLPINRRGEAASGHEAIDTPVPGGFHVYPEMAAAGLWTTASDLARWAIALSHSYRGEPGGVMSPSMARQMVSKQMEVKPPFGSGFWGLGVSVSGDGDTLSFSHGGRDEGFVANVVMWPNTGRGIAVMMSGVGGLLPEIMRSYAEEYGIGAPPRVARTSFAISTESLSDYVGKYFAVANNDTTRFEVKIAGPGMLTVSSSATRRAVPLVPTAADVFAGMEGGGLWTFERVGASVTQMVNGTGANRRVIVKQ